MSSDPFAAPGANPPGPAPSSRPVVAGAIVIVLAVVAVVLVLGFVLVARPFDEAGRPAPSDDPAAFEPFVYEPPEAAPSLALTDQSSAPFALADLRGRVVLVSFGYTHCPDVCPVHMANLAAVLNRLPDEISRRVRVVFVTTDPARDTPERLSTWLARFDADFVGLTGSPDELERAQVAAGVAPARPDSAAGADYAVGHAAQVMAYTPDGLGRVVYPSGTRQVDWAHDIPMLVRVGSGS
jgi:protein SCO1/2